MDFKMQKKQFGILAAVCAVLIGCGLFGLVQQYSFAEGAVAVNNYIPWGLYISLFLFFEAVGAGALLFAALTKESTVTRIKLAVVGVIGSCCAGIAIMPDLGNPLQMWRLFFSPNVASPLLLDVWLLSATIVFGVLLFVGLRWNKPGLAKVAKWGSVVFSSLLVLGTAIMFCSIAGKVGWESTSEIAISLIQALVCGVSAVVLLAASMSDEAKGRMARFAAILLVANLLMIIGEAMLLNYRDDYALKAFEAIMFGTYAPLFWLQVIVGIVAPAAMLFAGKGVKIALWLTLAGVLLSKYLYIMRGSIYPTYGQISPGAYIPVLAPAEGAQQIYTYVPTMGEWFVALAVIGLAVLLVALAFNTKLVPREGETD